MVFTTLNIPSYGVFITLIAPSHSVHLLHKITTT